jgi:hypothetical protein
MNKRQAKKIVKNAGKLKYTSAQTKKAEIVHAKWTSKKEA